MFENLTLPSFNIPKQNQTTLTQTISTSKMVRQMTALPYRF